LKTGQKFKKDGFIFGLFSVRTISKSKSLRLRKCFKMLIRHGEMSWMVQRKILLSLMLVLKTRLLKTFETAFTLLRRFKKDLMTTWTQREWPSLDSSFCQMMIYCIFFHRQKNHWEFKSIWISVLKVFKSFSLSKIWKLQGCIQA